MNKKILAILLSLLLVTFYFPVMAEKGGVTAVEGNVTISCLTEAEEGTPVSIFILPAIIESETDVTAEKIENINSPEALAALGVEYFGVVKAGEGGLVSHECKMKDSLPTGDCHVVFAFLGDDGAYIAGSFEHVGKNDIKNLVDSFNSADESDYSAIINTDINGDGLNPAKEILRKSSADVTYYQSLESKTDFHNVLFGFKPEEGFSLTTLVSKFNEAGVWIRLRENEDTLSTLKSYNGEGTGKYWNVAVDEGSDFAALGSEEQAKILDAIKKASYVKAADLEKGFTDKLVLSLFREVKTRESLAELIDENSEYSSYFTEVREIISDADLNEYYEALLYNAVLKGNKTCDSMTEINDLFENSVPEEEKKGGGGGGGGSSVSASGGYKSGTVSGGISLNSSPNSTIAPGGVADSKTGFTDVADDHWAADYIVELYKNGTVNGTGENRFSPSSSVKRQDFVKILVGALALELSDSPSVFTDVESGAYYEKYLMTAYEKGLISGTGDGIFGIDANIKREDAAVILSRVPGSYGIEKEADKAEFADSELIADYAKDAAGMMAALGIFSGDDNGNFNPKDSLTRAEACAIIVRLAEAVKGE